MRFTALIGVPLTLLALAGLLTVGCGPQLDGNQPKLKRTAQRDYDPNKPAGKAEEEPAADSKEEPAADAKDEPAGAATAEKSDATKQTPAPAKAASAEKAEVKTELTGKETTRGLAEEAKPEEEKEKPNPSKSESESDASSQEEKDESAGSQKVMLGSPELTAGIPGQGDLTIEEIRKWLDDPKNHETLEIELPLGLAAAAGQVKGLEENPLTRAKIELGRQLYFDPRLSADQTISCASCHDPDQGYAKNTQFGIGIKSQAGGRNSPVSYNRLFSEAQFWDGRAATLEDQATGPIANPIEMGFTHDACVECLKAIEGYRIQFEKIFGELTIDAVGKALASFERAIVTGPTPYDYYEVLRPFEKLSPEDLEDLKEDDPDTYAKYEQALAEAKAHPISDAAKRGRELFFGKAQCTACHAGANFTDEQYHNIGVGMDKEMPDLGRFDTTGEDKDRGAFKTPTIRNVALSAPYMHDGSQKTLEEVVEWYNKGGHPNPHLSEKMKKLDLNDQEKTDLVEFMKALTGDFPKVERGRLPPQE